MNNNHEILRKTTHIVFGILIILGLFFLDKGIFLRLLFIVFLLTILFTVLHLRYKIKLIDSISKESEKKFPLKGVLFFIIGSALVSIIFQKNIALASIAILTFGDATSGLASYFGKKYNIRAFKNYKNILGTFCGMIVAFLFALIFIDPVPAAIGAFFGMLSEAVAIKLGETDADDNLILPLAAATAMYIASRINLLGLILSNV